MSIPKPRTDGGTDAGREAGPETAADDLDLALARLRWAESCTCLRTAEQAAALQWLAAQVNAPGSAG